MLSRPTSGLRLSLQAKACKFFRPVSVSRSNSSSATLSKYRLQCGPQSVLAPSSNSTIKSLSYDPLLVKSFSTTGNTSETTSSDAASEEFDFQAETNQLLDIVTNSIYTDKEIFLRELVSNASDALEKLRHVQTSGEEIIDGGKDLDIKISCDEEAKTLTIEDSGIGMTKEEMMQNLGTIARSGSRAFRQDATAGEEAKANIIGQFGVGFYSAFMVGNKVDVYSKSSTSNSEDSVYRWSSPGHGKFSLAKISADDAEVENLRGTRVVIHLKDDCAEFSKTSRIREIVNKYSNYVSFPIIVDGEQANKVQAIWARDAKDVSDEEYSEFFKFCAHAFQDPLYRLHFKADVPIDIKALIFVPSMHTEKLGMGRMNPGVSIYSRKVLIEHNSEKLLPNWLRFVKGVVDSEDLPISISRESMQDSRLLANIGQVLTKRIIKHLQSEAKKDPKAFNEKFASEFGNFIKEGVCSDFTNQKDIAKLLRFSSSEMDPDELTSLDEYISRCDPGQDKIYYLAAPTKELAEASPYYEVFKSNKIEVLFLHSTLDDFSLGNLRQYEGREFVSAESGKVDLEFKKDEKDGTHSSKSLEKAEVTALQEWIKLELPDVVSDVRPTNRLRDSPAIVVDHESASMRRMMQMLQQSQQTKNNELGKQVLEINTSHPIIISLNDLRKSDTELARRVARQIFDNAVIAAGLVDDPRDMLPRLNGLIEKLLQKHSEGEASYSGPLPVKAADDENIDTEAKESTN
mmetsp:Transcript_13131/g.15150  ORF Transcript_13131/g.15150 Transcript_13131/m.15150 type:complete len:743 (-) Transcript_13131:149-2377(-)|eukprot:CAMPEP_0204834016 /NCGR_PEP_ID=MMETSP1346-20131115/18477_1 /ASSEMBLY_ACC=CAM_ASM_000771 /TAXON_ID=215587 /ORGANISM="Aplanochytrium stocchinoi, Strain GSBS06" /LENGTH=742 /DNA_ID=CAMNT_0051966991 /DNA_START=163 /DNA_END=2391 /DNA_ORIENTATION=+